MIMSACMHNLLQICKYYAGVPLTPEANEVFS